MNGNRRHRGARPRGITLIETAATTTIACIALAGTMGGFGDMLQRHRLEGHAHQLVADLQQLRFEAVSRNQGLRVHFDHHTEGSCYLLHTGAAGDCFCNAGGAARCSNGAAEIKTVWLPASGGMQIDANVSSLRFDPVLGTVTPTASVKLASGTRHLNVVVNLMGRARICTPDGSMPRQLPC
jgi:type IV fimbrial biogenesis protein FimT